MHIQQLSNLLVMTSKQLYNYLIPRSDNRLELFGAYIDQENNLVLHSLSATTAQTHPPSHKKIATLLNEERDMYNWDMYFHMFAYDTERETIAHILQRNQYSFKLSIPDNKHIDDVEEKLIAEDTDIDKLIGEDYNAIIFEGRLFMCRTTAI